jgi:hypothetical protein
MVVGDALAGAAIVAVPASAGDVRASVTEPAGLSAISLTSRVVRTSLRRPPRDWMMMLAGPLKCRKSCWRLARFCKLDRQLETNPITPDGLASPGPQCESSVAGESPHSRLPHGLPETCVWQQVRRIRNLEPQKVRLEPIRCGCMLLHAVCDQVAGVYNVLLAGLEGDLVDLAFATQSEKTTASGVSVTPVGNALGQSACVHLLATCIFLPCLCSREAIGLGCVRSMPIERSSVLPSSPVCHPSAQ